MVSGCYSRHKAHGTGEKALGTGRRAWRTAALEPVAEEAADQSLGMELSGHANPSSFACLPTKTHFEKKSLSALRDPKRRGPFTMKIAYSSILPKFVVLSLTLK